MTMATLSPTDNTTIQQLLAAKEQLHAAKEAFRLSNWRQHWTEERLELEWTRFCTSANNAGAGYAATGIEYTPGIPRTVPAPTTAAFNGWHFGPSMDTTQDGSRALDMNRLEGCSTQSAPANTAPTMTRSPSVRAPAKRSFSTYSHGSSHAAMSRRHYDPDAPFDNYTFGRTGSAQKPPAPSIPDDIVEYHPSAWVLMNSGNIDFAPHPPATAYPDPTHLSASSILSDRPLLDSPVPSDSATDLTDASTLSTQMSRNLSTVSSHSYSLPHAMNDMNINASHPDFNLTAFDLKPHPPLTQENLTAITQCAPSSYPPSKRHVVGDGIIRSPPVSIPCSLPSARLSPEPTLSSPNTAHPMKREESAVSISSSTSSNRGQQSRSARRHQEQLERGKIPIRRKEEVDQQDTVAPQMKRITSETGEVKEVMEIARKPVHPRAPREKLLCPYCSDHPEGFRGEHELQRHNLRAHPQGTRKVWMCVDITGKDPDFLSRCKACRDGKRYGAYYNAAAHLRRTHFNPRKRGRKAKSEAEKRGGKGGGDHPPMIELKKFWLREIEEVVTDKSPSVDFSYADADVQLDDANEELLQQQQADEAAGTPTTSTSSYADDAATWPPNNVQVDPSTAANLAADILSFEFAAAGSTSTAGSAAQHLDMISASALDAQFAMFDGAIPPADMGAFVYDDGYIMQHNLPTFQDNIVATWAQ